MKESENILLNENEILPWHEAPWAYLCNKIELGRLPHALLFHGRQGMGKLFFAKQYARLLLCQSPVNKFACGHCRTCLLMKAQTHPDYYEITPDDSGKIKIEQIRNLTSTLAMTSSMSALKLILIDKPENMQNAAANALLKTLEEPPGQQVQFLLITNQLERLPATIRSRCQKFFFAPAFDRKTQQWLSQYMPGPMQVYDYLSLHEGAPLAVLNYFQTKQQDTEKKWLAELQALYARELSPLAVAQTWSESDPILLLDFLQMVLTNYIQQQLIGKKMLGCIDDKVRWKMPDIFSVLDKLQLMKQRLLTKTAINNQLALEEIIFSCVHSFKE